MNIRRILLAVLCAAACYAARAGQTTIDHRYLPERQYTLLNLPFDPHKTILLGSGNLAYDFGPGPYHSAGTEIGFGFSGTPSTVAAQYFPESGFPLARTEITGGAGRLTETAFTLIPDSTGFRSSFRRGRVRRLGHLAGAAAWARPPAGTDPAFRNAAWGTNRPIEYRVSVPPGSARIVVLGVCEGYKSGPGQRVMDFIVEGAPPQTFDPVGDGKNNTPHVLVFAGRDADGDGEISIAARFSPLSGDPNCILNAFWIFPEGTSIDTDAVIHGTMPAKAEVRWQCGSEEMLLSPVPRSDGIIASYTGDGPAPALFISTRRPLRYDRRRGVIELAPGMTLRCRPAPLPGTHAPGGTGESWTFTFPEGTKSAEVTVTEWTGKNSAVRARPLPEEIRRAREYWRSERGIPQGRFAIPDSALQGILDVNIRTIYQAADIVDGSPVFQPGPTVYRGLFLYDLLLMGDPVMSLGDTEAVRGFIEGTFHYQQQDGRVRVLTPANSYLETPVFVDALGRYAMLTGNRDWMEKHWPRMAAGVHWMRNITRSTMLEADWRRYGLFPPGFVDGGLAGSVPDFSTVTFGLMALETASRTARWLGHANEESEWRSLFDELMRSYVRAARMSLRRDRFGTTYLPVVVGDTSTTAPPQRGQYGLLGAIRYAKFFRGRTTFLDSIAAGNMTMLDSTLVEGMIANAGWTADAVWSWLGLAHASALSARGEGARACRMVYDVANHSGRLGTWVEEQQIQGMGTRSTGDGSDAETSACLVGAVRDLLFFDRGDTIDILPGVPRSWFRPGAHIACRDVPTESGRLTIDVASSASDVRITILLSAPPAEASPAPVVSIPGTTLRAMAARGLERAADLSGRIVRGKELVIRLERTGSFVPEE